MTFTASEQNYLSTLNRIKQIERKKQWLFLKAPTQKCQAEEQRIIVVENEKVMQKKKFSSSQTFSLLLEQTKLNRSKQNNLTLQSCN